MRESLVSLTFQSREVCVRYRGDHNLLKNWAGLTHPQHPASVFSRDTSAVRLPLLWSAAMPARAPFNPNSFSSSFTAVLQACCLSYPLTSPASHLLRVFSRDGESRRRCGSLSACFWRLSLIQNTLGTGCLYSLTGDLMK